MEIYAFLSDITYAYTGLSPAAFVTILSLMIRAYCLLSFFVHPDSLDVTEKSAVATPPPTMEQPPSLDAAEKTTTPPMMDQPPSSPPLLMAEPVQMGEMTLEGLREYNGSDPNKPLLVSIKGDVYNVSRGCSFSGITLDKSTTELPAEICSASPVRELADDLVAEKVESLMRRLAMAIQYSRSVVDKGGFYGNKEQEMNEFDNGVKGAVDLKEMSLRKLKAMYREKLLHLRSSK